MRQTGQMKAAAILLILHITTTKTAKNSAPSVHEIINEQARIDDKRPLAFANPLAGNSQQNAKLHAQHQQAMFNAERVRQHRAQIQRWNKAPQQVDSYMKAYHESQENHQLALEQMQATQKDKKVKARQDRPNLRSRPQLEPVKLTRADAVDKNRNHRSFGSVYHNVQKKRKVNTSPGTTYDQGVTIKPNGNIGLNNLEKEQAGSNLYTEVIPSKTQYVYPKLYNQMNLYHSAEDIHALNTLLTKTPQEQITELNTMTHLNEEIGKNTLETPIDLFFYLNNHNAANGKYNVQNDFTGPYANEYANYNDHKPITEDVDDIEEDKGAEIKTYPVPQTPTPLPLIYADPATTKSNYYKVEVEQSIQGNNFGKNVQYSAAHDKPSYGGLVYEKPLNFHTQPSTDGVKYLQAEHSGVQHLSHDGTGVSAYGDDDVSIKKRRVKRQLDTGLFILGNEILPVQNTSNKNEIQSKSNNTNDDTDFGVSLDAINTVNKSLNAVNKTSQVATDRNETLPTPAEWKRKINFYDDHPAGEAKDYDYYEDDSNSRDYFYDGDYDPDYEFSPPDLNYPSQNNFKGPTPFTRTNRQRNNPNVNQNFDTENSFSNRYASYKHPNFNDFHFDGTSDEYGPPSTKYGPPNTNYGPPIQQYGPPKNQFRGPKQQYGPPNRHPEISSLLDSLEPVYMLTESQLKNIAGQHHVNVQHLDVFQYPSLTKPRQRIPRRAKKHRSNRRPRKLRKFRKLNKLIHY